MPTNCAAAGCATTYNKHINISFHRLGLDMNDALKGSETFLFKSAVTLKACCVLSSKLGNCHELNWQGKHFDFSHITVNCGGVESSLIAKELSDVNESAKDKLSILNGTVIKRTYILLFLRLLEERSKFSSVTSELLKTF